jgi:Lar family restriction alleviation protein
MSDERKPCPHCGSDRLQFERWVDLDGVMGRPNTVLYRIFCETCSYSPDHWEEAIEKVIQYWNTRSIEDALRAEIAALKVTLAKSEKGAVSTQND